MADISLEETNKRSIHILITHYGDSFLDYPRFFYENRNLLEEYGIAYPWADSYQGDMFWQGRLCTFFELLPEIKDRSQSYTLSIEHKLNHLAQILQHKRSLLFVGPVGILAGLDRLLYILRDGIHFPNWVTADVHCLWLACDRAHELEGACRYNLPHDCSESLYKNGLVNKSIWLGKLARLLRCADKDNLVILPDIQTDQHIDVRNLLKGLGLSIPPELCIPVKNTPLASRKNIYANKLLGQALGNCFELLQNVLDDSFADSSKYFIDPAKLLILHRSFAPAMEAIANAHGTAITFSPPQPHADWKPFEPPRPEVFLNILQNALPTFPPEKQEYCLRILGKAWDSPLGPEAQTHIATLHAKLRLPPPNLPLVSVLTLAKNHEKYIGQCIESVLAQQTDFSVEHIIVDDCSTDSTTHIIAHYARKYKSITPVFLSGGAAPGRNVQALFNACKSKYAALCDGDDYFSDPQKLQKQVDFMEKYPQCSVCFHPVDVHYEDSSPSRVYPPEDLLPGGVRTFYSIKDLLYANMMQTNSVMYRWRFVDGIPDWFDPSLVPADWYWHLLHAEVGIIGYLREHMSVYRRHTESLYASAEGHHVAHRAKHGLEELRMYSACNKHFNNKYYSDLCRLATGVFADFLSIYIKTGDDSLLQKGIIIAPDFAKDFLEKVKVM